MSEKMLTTKQVHKLDTKFNEKFKVNIDGYSLYIDKYFRKTKIAQMIAELQDKIQEASINEYQLVSILSSYGVFLYIKYFTSLGKDISNDLSEQLVIMNKLIDADLFSKIIEKMPQDQIDLVAEQIRQATVNINKFADEFDKLELENADILKEGVDIADISQSSGIIQALGETS